MQIYQGILYGAIPDQSENVRIELKATGLHLIRNGENLPVFLDYTGLEVEWNGPENNQLECRKGEYTLYTLAPPILSPLLEHTQGTLHEQLLQIKKKSRKRHVFAHWGMLTTTALLGSALLVWGSFQSLYWAQNYVIEQIPPEWETQLGEQAYQEMKSESKPCKNDVLKSAVDTLGDKLFQAVPDSPYPFKFHVVDSEVVNAFALPGGHMVINSALLQEAPSPEAVAGVMAHEMQHVLLRHGMKGMVTKLGFTLLVPAVFGDMGTVMLMMGGMGAHLINLSFNRGQESAADMAGLKLLRRAQINPQGMVDFFEFLAQKEEGKLEESLKFMSTHPLSSERVQQLSTEINQLPATTYPPLLENWEQIQKEACS